MNLKDKKALEAQVLIGIIITIVVVIIIFLFLRGWHLTEIIDKEACHQSVLMRSIPTVVGTPFRKNIPLKCETESILINYDESALIKQRIANAMYDCWWMLGEGKLNFFSAGLLRKNYCVICSTIRFDGSARNRNIKDFQDYLATEKVPLKDITYLQYITNSESEEPEVSGVKQTIDTTKEYAVVFSFFKGEMLSNVLMGGAAGLAGAKAGAIVGSFVAPGLGTVIGAGAGLVIGGTIGWITQSKWKDLISGREEDYFASLYLIEFDKDDIENMGCTNIESIP